MAWIIAWAACAVIFGALDAVWLGWAGNNFYRPHLGDLLAANFRMVPALAFYAAYVSAICWFAIRPGLGSGVASAALNGALLGAICYATYDLTNQATLRHWPVVVTIADIAWGAFATAVAAAAATYLSLRVA